MMDEKNFAQIFNIKKITEDFLRSNGFDGLFNVDEDCACEIRDLAPCESNCMKCEPGVKRLMTQAEANEYDAEFGDPGSWIMCKREHPLYEADRDSWVKFGILTDDFGTPQTINGQPVYVANSGHGLKRQFLFYFDMHDNAFRCSIYEKEGIEPVGSFLVSEHLGLFRALEEAGEIYGEPFKMWRIK